MKLSVIINNLNKTVVLGDNLPLAYNRVNVRDIEEFKFEINKGFSIKGRFIMYEHFYYTSKDVNELKNKFVIPDHCIYKEEVTTVEHGFFSDKKVTKQILKLENGYYKFKDEPIKFEEYIDNYTLKLNNIRLSEVQKIEGVEIIR